MSMRADVRRNFVIAIYGVGNPAPGDVERSLSATLSAVDAAFDVHEFDWNAFAPHAPRARNRLWRYGRLFSGSFAAAAWFRTTRTAGLERLRTAVDAAVHVLWAGTQSAFLTMSAAAAVLHLGGAASVLFSSWLQPLTMSGVLPGDVGSRAASVSSDVLVVTLELIRYGTTATLALVAASLSIAVLQAVMCRSMRPLPITVRRHVFLLLLGPCALLSLILFHREDRESPLAVMESGGYWILMALGIGAMGAISIFLGGARTTLGWITAMPAILLAIVIGNMLIQFLRGRAAPAWLGGAKVLLDIGLYVGMPSYRATIQANLDRIVATIPERSTTPIWIVAHSLGSVIALDSLTNSPAWTSADRVRLVTLGSPIRRFFIRFFPHAFFEPRIDDAARTVAGRLAEFTWLNAFRRFDYIGTALGFRERGLDLPTRQLWPAHANYWGDVRVARTVVGGWQQARPIEPPQSRPAADAAPRVVVGMTERAQTALRRVSFTCAAVVAVVSMAGASWLFVPGLRRMIVHAPVQLQIPTAATARVRHERGFTGDGARLHDFRFDIRDEVTGRVHQVWASVPGFFGLWSDPRFDYLALARFIRADCRAERTARFYEFGWSVPCSRDGVRLEYDRSDPSRFRVIGFENRPGYIVRGLRFALVVLMGILSLLIPTLGLPALWLALWTLFLGQQEMAELISGVAEQQEIEKV
jgi:hypothetical protein